MRTKLFFSTRVSSLSKLNHRLRSDAYSDSKYFIIVDENTYNHCLPTLIAQVSALQEAEFFELPVGEEAKRMDVVENIWEALLESRADRDSVIINLGGGCVSDVGGFVAAGYRRGIRYINVPTTLIGMVDAAIGGKTAVNLGCTKNQVGFFHYPEAVCIHPDFLRTLPGGELISGLFEVIKMLMLFNNDGLTQLESDICKRKQVSVDLMRPYLEQCVEYKSRVVAVDPQEHSVRKVLNLGHTFGHGIESFMMERGTPVSHGIAVGMGLACALYLSVMKLGLKRQVLKDYCSMLRCIVEVPRFTLRDTEQILHYMYGDKKNSEGLILCVLLQEVGVPVIDVSIDENEVRDTLLRLGKELV